MASHRSYTVWNNLRVKIGITTTIFIILLTLVIFITYRLQHSRVGRAWVAIREDEQAAESMGINVSRYKSLAFAVSAAIGALGGGFIAQFQVSISVPFFDFWESILILVYGSPRWYGKYQRCAMIGAAILGSLGEVLTTWLSSFPINLATLDTSSSESSSSF